MYIELFWPQALPLDGDDVSNSGRVVVGPYWGALKANLGTDLIKARSG